MASTALLIIDMQVDFFRHEWLSARRDDLVRKTNQLVALMRRAHVPVIWVRQEFSHDLTDAPLDVKRHGFRVTIAGTAGASLLQGLDVGNDVVLVKKRYSAFFGTHLDELLRQHECNRVIVAGVNTHACIRATVIDAYQRDYDVIVATDCVDSSDLEHHDISLRYMDGKLAWVMSNSDISKLLA